MTTTDTPRTDALINAAQKRYVAQGCDDLFHYMGMTAELSAHARDLERLLREQQWVAVTERAPESGALVLCCSMSVTDLSKAFFVAWHVDRWITWDGSKPPAEVTHWMPLPAPPRGRG